MTIDAATLEPTVTWGTTPAQSVPVSGRVPDPESFADAAERESAVRALAYMGLEPGTPIADIALDTVFLGSCTNGRIEICARPRRCWQAGACTTGCACSWCRARHR